MAKNLYIHTIYKNGKYNLEVWEDVKVTRDTKRIVTKRNADYRLSHGNYKHSEMLEMINVSRYDIDITTRKKIPTSVEYITFNDGDIDNKIKSQMIEIFIDIRLKQIEELENKKNDILQEITALKESISR